MSGLLHQLRMCSLMNMDFGTRNKYTLCDSIPVLESYVAYVNKELEMDTKKGRQ